MMERISREMWMRAKARSFEYRARERERRKEEKRTKHSSVSLASPWKLSWSYVLSFFSFSSLHPSSHSLARSFALALVMRFSLFRIPSLAFSLFLSPSPLLFSVTLYRVPICTGVRPSLSLFKLRDSYDVMFYVRLRHRCEKTLNF